MKKTILASSLGFIALLTACGGGGADSSTSTATAVNTPTPTASPAPSASPIPAPQAVNISFVAKSGAEAVKCGTPITSIGNPSTAAQLKDLRLYLSNVVLITSDNREVPLKLTANDWQNSEVALIDLEDGTGSCAGGTSATNANIMGEVPAGTYTGLKMTVGVPSNQNHTDYATASAPMNVQAMAWSWQSGRKFAKIEVTDPQGVAGTWTAKTFMVHLGSTGCTGNPATGATTTCTSSNRMDVKLSSFNPANQNVVIDLQTLLANSNVTINGGGPAGCMSGKTDPECTAIFSAFKIDLNAGTSINGGDGQQLFRVEAK